MQYLLLIYADENGSPMPTTPEEQEAAMRPWFEYTNALRDSGAMIAGDALQPVATATTVRLRDGQRLVTDGPFAETREQLGGYYLIEAKNLDEALEWAARCPGSAYGSIEVRPVVKF